VESSTKIIIEVPDALKAVAEYFKDDFSRIISGDTNLPFLPENIYENALTEGVEFTDMRKYDSFPFKLQWADGSEKTAKISLLPQSVFTVSLSLPKIHECLAFSGCTENMAGCIVKNKQAVHGVQWWSRFSRKRAYTGNLIMNTNLMRVLDYAKPNISVLDCHDRIEFDGTKNCKVAMSSDDYIAIDKIASRMMGLQYVAHLSIAHTYGFGNAKLDKIKIAKDGFDSWSEISFLARPHYNYFVHKIPFDIRHTFYALTRLHRLIDMRIEKRLERDVL
ncbi:MAG: DUF362 domain-containing protein, partial [Candidatus Aenigmarchaeota archaeon]|nr:DUF362 domain-containing protein [Candidatus Aenigmarchaeota archaeon]